MLAPAKGERKLAQSVHKFLRDFATPIIFNISLLPFVFVSPVRRWLGDNAFFVFILGHLGFYPGGNTLGAQLELVIFGLIVSTFWLGLSFLIVCVQVWVDQPEFIYSSKATRGIGAAYMFVSFLVAGALWSWIPRLRKPLRVGMYVQIWALAGALSEITSKNFTNLFYPVAVTAVLSLVSNFCVPRSGRYAYFKFALSTIDRSRTLVLSVMQNFDAEMHIWNERLCLAQQTGRIGFRPPSLEQSSAFIEQRQQLQSEVNLMRAAFVAARHELAWCYMPVDKLAFISNYLNSIVTWMNTGFGMVLPAEDFEEKIQHLPNDEEAVAQGANDVPEKLTQASKPIQITASMSRSRGSCLAPENVDSAASTAPSEMESSTEMFTETRSTFSTLHKAVDNALETFIIFLLVIHGEDFKDNALADAITNSRCRHNSVEPALKILAQQVEALDQAVESTREYVHQALLRRGRPYGLSDSESLKGATAPSTRPGTPLPSVYSASNVPILNPPTLFRGDTYAFCAYTLSLFELARCSKEALREVMSCVRFYSEQRIPRIYLPHWDIRRWLGTSGGLALFQTALMFGEGSHGASAEEADENRTPAIYEPGLLEQIFDEEDLHGRYRSFAEHMGHAVGHTHVPTKGTSLLQRIMRRMYLVLHRPRVLHWRILLSQAFRSVRRSRHIHYALKLAAGSTLLSIAAFLEPDKRAWWKRENGTWIVISYIWSLEESTGSMIRTVVSRVIGTIIGAVLGLLAYEISRGNLYGLAVLLIVFELPASAMRLRSSFPIVGTVMGLTTIIVGLVPWLQGSEQSTVHVALVRSYMILLGIVAALIVNTFFWPYHARVMFMKTLSQTLTHIHTLYLSTARQMFHAGFETSPKAHERFMELESDISKGLGKCSMLLNMMKNEISFVPKPIKLMQRFLIHVQTTFDLFVTLRICREQNLQDARQEAIWDVVHLRQELVSSLCLDLWVLSQSLITRARLPQFLPSTRKALDELTAAFALRHGELYVHSDHAMASSSGVWRRLHDGPEIQLPDMPRAPRRRAAQHAPPPRAIDNSLYLLAEHSILAQLVRTIEILLRLLRLVLGELRFIQKDDI